MSTPALNLGEQVDLQVRVGAVLTDPVLTVDQKVAAVYAAADELNAARPGRPTLLEWLDEDPKATDHTVKMAMRRANAHVSVVREPTADDTVIMPPVLVDEPVVAELVVDAPVVEPVAAGPVVTTPATAAEPGKRSGYKGFYVVALMSIGVSVDTSWRFFEHKLGITNVVERALLFSVMEAALIACGWGMRAGVLRDGKPGYARLVAWALTAFAAYAALMLSGLGNGIARVALGPVLGLVMLHLALGIELRATHQRTTTWARVGRELRERLLSVLGLGDDHRDALARTRDRAALRAAKLSLASKWTPFRDRRLRNALHVSNVAHDAVQRGRMLAEINVLKHAAGLGKLDQPSPWPTSAS
ncbi:hypothetical protein [Lentzea sp. NBRC 102530]|uniref:hypothetical protein n=1 Tax=Lentzea sp. NBRC 102530 TaxID=3032201 RepID=UPI0024A497AA|nr:hypothetical protein [Lentzea sp. NBRC 102530]GLY55189.1 hypothetical protein Lesp01_88440 [Lentzea sp. NBRC 102530]